MVTSLTLVAPNGCGTTQWFLVLRKIFFESTERTKLHQKPLSDDYNHFQLTERRSAAC